MSDFLAALAEMNRKQLALDHLLDFCRLVVPTYQTPKHIVLLAEYLTRLEAGHIDRFVCQAPPRHGKSRMVSQLFAAWYLGRNPTHDIVLAAYGSELTERNSRALRDLVTDERNPFDVAIREDSRAIDRWHTTAGGQVLAVSVGSGLTGHGANLLVIDDPVKDRVEAESEAIRKSTYDWYSDVARTRLAPGGKIVLMGTRWHFDDLIGSVLQNNQSRWTVLNLPAIAEENDPLGRAVGDALWPERWPLESLPKVPEEMSSRSFAALFLGRPQNAEGSVFKASWFERRYSEFPRCQRAVRPTSRSLWRNYSETVEEEIPLQIISAIDCASKVTLSADFSAIVTIAFDGCDYYILDVVRERLEFADLMRRIVDVYQRYNPRLVVIEEASSGIPIVQELKRSTGLPVVGIPPKGSKVARADAISNLWESGRVALPQRAHWLDSYISEMTQFPSGKHDDVVDATTLGLSSLQVPVETRLRPTYVLGYGNTAR